MIAIKQSFFFSVWFQGQIRIKQDMFSYFIFGSRKRWNIIGKIFCRPKKKKIYPSMGHTGTR